MNLFICFKKFWVFFLAYNELGFIMTFAKKNLVIISLLHFFLIPPLPVLSHPTASSTFVSHVAFGTLIPFSAPLVPSLGCLYGFIVYSHSQSNTYIHTTLE